jgi:hypothetical protein
MKNPIISSVDLKIFATTVCYPLTRGRYSGSDPLCAEVSTSGRVQRI